jgi:hypothetical protein
MSETSMESRELLTAIGVGNFNATGIIPYMMVAPATTDPKASQIIILVQQIQRALWKLGAMDVLVSGRLDEATERALEQVAGPNWERMSWGANVKALIDAERKGFRIQPTVAMAYQPMTFPVAVDGPLDFLPEVPGGIVTYGIGAYILYCMLSKRRSR